MECILAPEIAEEGGTEPGSVAPSSRVMVAKAASTNQ